MRIAIIGSGYVGLVTGACLAKIGHEVRCVDVDPGRISSIRNGVAPFFEPGLNDLLTETVASGALRPTIDLADALADAEISIIAVGTPPSVTGEGEIDLSFVRTVSRQIGECLRDSDQYHVIVVKSTVVPGTADTLVRQAVEETSGKKAGEFGLCMNPEFLREGSAVGDFMVPDRIVIGQLDERSGETVARMYDKFECPVIRTSLRNAEMMKYTSNCLLAVLISFSNEIANICERTPGTDVDVVMDGLSLDRRLSPVINGTRVGPEILSYLRPGIGFGGSCLPKDVNAMRAFASSNDIATRVLDATIEVNDRRCKEIVRLLKSDGGSRGMVAVLGLAFKPGTDDLRDSPAIALVQALLDDGWTIKAFDPRVTGLAVPGLSPSVRVCETVDEAFEKAEAVILATAWREFLDLDWAPLLAGMNRKVVVDGRNALRSINWPDDVDFRPVGVAVGSRI